MGTPYEMSKYKVHPYFFAVHISFHVLDISRFKNVGVGEMCVCVWGGGGCMVSCSSPWPTRRWLHAGCSLSARTTGCDCVISTE